MAAGIAGAFAVVALLLLVPSLSAATTPIASFQAPYTGAKAVQVRDPSVQGCGANLTVWTPTRFVLTTGTGTGAVAAQAGPCASADSQASYDGTAGLSGLGFVAALSGNRTVTASWVITWSGSATVSPKAAASGGDATVEMSLTTKLVDLTAGKTYRGRSVQILQKELQTAKSWTGGAVDAKYSATVGSVPLVAGHHYAIYAVIEFSVESSVPQGSPAGSTVTTALDLASTGHGAILTSVHVA